MPGSISITVSQTFGEIEHQTPRVLILKNGKYQEITNLTCLSCSQSTGVVPATATFRLYKETDSTGPNTLTRIDPYIKHGMRVKVMVGKVTVFLGQLMIKQDQGAPDEIRYTAYDDKFFLSKIPIRGSFVRDTSGVVDMKFIPRYNPRTNPSGKWNCVGCRLSSEEIVPVFSQVAVLGKSYRSPDEAFQDELQEGIITAWTPKRFLRYLNYAANVSQDSTIPGVRVSQWRGINSGQAERRLLWDLNSVLGLSGVDPAEGAQPDPLDKKMPDMSFQGLALGAAIQKTLDMAGTHVLKLDLHSEESTNTGGATGIAQAPAVKSSRLGFSPIGYSGATTGKELNLAVQDDAKGNPDTIYDFTLFEDSTQTSTGVLVEGDVPILETSIAYEDDGNNDTLIPAWTSDEEDIFKAMIRGDGTNASVPHYQGISSVDDLVVADGTDNTPTIVAISKEAVRMARMCYPNVFRLFYVNSYSLASKLHGVSSVYDNEYTYPILKGDSDGNHAFRPIGPTQEQSVTTTLASTDEPASRMLAKYPVRIRVKETGGEWYESLYTSGLKVMPDGKIALDGIGENLETSTTVPPECLYENPLLNAANANVKLKHIKINCTMPMDHRVVGYEETNWTELDNDYVKNAIDGPPLIYIDSQGAYTEIHQVDSEPSATLQFRTNDGSGIDGTTVSPLTRYLPPGSEAKHAKWAAQRRLAYTRNIVRKSSWKFAGIRIDQKPGEWVYRVVRRGYDAVTGTEEVDDYKLDAPIESVTFDFVKQITIVGGLVSNIGA